MQRLKTLIEKYHIVIVLLFFAVVLATGIMIYDDYGISWDEHTDREYGQTVYKYIVQGNQNLLSYRNRYHGPVFPLALFSLERALKLSETRTVFLMRHLLTFLFFYLGVIVFYFFSRWKFGSWKAGLLACLFLVLSPRIFAHSFYNAKDIPCMVMFIVSAFTLLWFLRRKTLASALAHVVCCSVLIGIRFLGVLIPAFTLFFVIGDLLVNTVSAQERRRLIAGAGVYFILLMMLVVLLWPTLWSSPLKNFIDAFINVGGYQKIPFFLGQYTKSPWYYYPLWIAISLPLWYLCCFFLGVFEIIRAFFRAPRAFYTERKADLLFLLWFFGPIVGLIVIRACLYDEWRQVFFIYPAFIGIALNGLLFLWRHAKKVRRRFWRTSLCAGVIGITALSFVQTLYFMVRYHPYQNVYFNGLLGDMKTVSQQFDLDYWGLSYRQAYDYILKNDKRPHIKVAVVNWPAVANSYMLTAKEKARIEIVFDLRQADYVIDNRRYTRNRKNVLEPFEWHAISVKGAKLVIIYRLSY